MHTFTLRAATLADVSQIAQVHHTARLETYPGLIPEAHLHAKTLEQRLAEYHAFIHSGGFCTIAESEGKVVGLCTAGPYKDNDPSIPAKGEVYAFYILQSHKRKGIGTALLASALEHLRDGQLVPVIIACYKQNRTAQSFYKAQKGCYLKDRFTDFGRYTICSACYLFK